MRTVEEHLKEYFGDRMKIEPEWEYFEDVFIYPYKPNVEDIYNLIEQAQTEAYNQAIDDAILFAMVWSKGGVDMSHLLNKESILKLKR